jgi:hypothetical protein
MRLGIVLVMIIAVCCLIGWVTFSNVPGRTMINIETDQIRTDTDQALQSGARILRNAGEEIENRCRRKTTRPRPSKTSRRRYGNDE